MLIRVQRFGCSVRLSHEHCLNCLEQGLIVEACQEASNTTRPPCSTTVFAADIPPWDFVGSRVTRRLRQDCHLMWP